MCHSIYHYWPQWVKISINVILSHVSFHMKSLDHNGLSEWVIKSNSLSRTAESGVHVVHISCIIIIYTLSSNVNKYFTMLCATTYDITRSQWVKISINISPSHVSITAGNMSTLSCSVNSLKRAYLPHNDCLLPQVKTQVSWMTASSQG